MVNDHDAPRIVQVGSGKTEPYGWGEIEWLANKDLTPGSEMTLGQVRLGPGGSNPRHIHPNCHELLLVLSGCIEHDLGASTVELKAGSLLHVPIGVPHQARNNGKTDCLMIVTYSTEDRKTVFIAEDR